jgi:hypothetical protein
MNRVRPFTRAEVGRPQRPGDSPLPTNQRHSPRASASSISLPDPDESSSRRRQSGYSRPSSTRCSPAVSCCHSTDVLQHADTVHSWAGSAPPGSAGPTSSLGRRVRRGPEGHRHRAAVRLRSRECRLDRSRRRRRQASRDRAGGAAARRRHLRSLPACRAGDDVHCSTGALPGRFTPGGFAQFIRTNARACIPLPDGVTPVDVGPPACGGITAYHAVTKAQSLAYPRVAYGRHRRLGESRS